MQELGPNQTKWLNELETTDKPQGHGGLKTGIGYCCLGIACELFFGPPKESTQEWFGASGYAPEELVKELNLYSRYAWAKGIGDTSLPTLNDKERKSFKEIAAIIREDPAMYFSGPA